MGLTREQFDIIYNKYNNKRLNNELKSQNRLKDVYSKVPEIKECDLEISSLAVNAAKKPCECLQREIVNSLYTSSQLSDILERENFDTFNFDYYSEDFIDEASGTSALDNIETVVDYCRYYIKNFDTKFDNLLFYGGAGSGKTFLVNCIAKELIDKSYTVLYLSAVAFFDLLSNITFNKGSSSAFGQVTMHEILECDLLVIDDLGSEMANSFTDSALFDCLNNRLIHHKSTIISTNLSLEDLNNSYSDRIYSRVLGEYTIFKIFGDDIRIKKQIIN